jgi:hypothetical protein
MRFSRRTGLEPEFRPATDRLQLGAQQEERLAMETATSRRGGDEATL